MNTQVNPETIKRLKAQLTSLIGPAPTPKFSWKQAPDLMARLTTAQNSLVTPIDIVTFAAFCDSREELERHVVRYEARVAEQVAS